MKNAEVLHRFVPPYGDEENIWCRHAEDQSLSCFVIIYSLFNIACFIQNSTGCNGYFFDF